MDQLTIVLVYCCLAEIMGLTFWFLRAPGEFPMREDEHTKTVFSNHVCERTLCQ